ncbi:MAG: adenylate/guanylate cyclase domain-containing protein [Minwuia sp.]|uniref:adenylate/guanylate cyclase domain-containing protein n=1 Tax=Minwuia sp. TaxID=2493630 RepID=UPI003A88B33B
MTIRLRLADLRELLYSRPDAIPEGPAARFAVEAIEQHKREGMELAFRARMTALAVFAVMMPFLGGRLEDVIYYETLMALLAVVGWLQRRMAQVGRSQVEMALIFADILIMALAIAVPNPLAPADWPAAMQFRSEGFKYFYIFLAFGTLAYSWRTVRGIGSITATVWLATVALVWLLSTPDAELGAAAAAAFGHSYYLIDHLDPNSLLLWIRAQEIVVFLVVAWVLSTTVRRYSRLLLQQAGLERERTNLARYFSPNVVEDLSQNDEPLKQVRNQDVAVLFVDIVGFTTFAAERPAGEVIETLRAFHARMETQVFAHRGTLDKYLGDGLMATFGTPTAGLSDAANALACARGMAETVAEWNAERTASGEAPVRIGVGVHYGPAVLGNIGVNRLEFAVIGDTVNTASRVEALTRGLEVTIAATGEAVTQARAETGGGADPAEGFEPLGPQQVRGREQPVEIWGLA